LAFSNPTSGVVDPSTHAADPSPDKKFKITYRTADKERNTHWAHVGGPLPIFEAMLHGPSERPTDQAIFRERKI
jgi:hypothetical protein